MKALALIVALTTAVAAVTLAEEPNDAARKAIEANDRAYEAAYAKADVKALVDFFAEDADYTADDGRTYSGRAEIEGAIKSGLLASRGSKLEITIDSVKVLTPETVVEKGYTTVTSKNGEASSDLYTAIHIKQDGKWKISQLIETPAPETTPADRLAELAWLVGEWEDSDKNDDVNVRSQYLWSRGRNFLTRNVTVKRGGEVTLEGWQIIGWDPVAEKLRSWTFDSEGGFADGYFTREGSRWLLRETGVTPDGSRTSADNTFTKLSDDKLTWESNNRTLNGDPQPSISKVEINRVKGR